VALRGRRREALSRNTARIAFRGAIVTLLACGLFQVFMAQNCWWKRFTSRHTPNVEITVSPALSALPLAAEIPASRYLLWVPGVTTHIERRLKKKFPEVGDITFQKEYAANRIVVHAMERHPLVLWNHMGIDAAGVPFSMPPDDHVYAELETPLQPWGRDLGQWLHNLAQHPWLWHRIVRLSQNAQGQWLLTLSDGGIIQWGDVEPNTMAAKCDRLSRLYQNSTRSNTKSLSADLRFFAEGRIIVRTTAAVRRS
jgi:hypothetical protein